MNRLFILLLIILTCSCTKQNEKREKTIGVEKSEIATPDFDVALRFINSYAEYCDKLMKKEAVDSNWIYNNKLLTESFKEKYKSIIDSAFAEEPELGLDADPIFDAQDYPNKGFEMMATDHAEHCP